MAKLTKAITGVPDGEIYPQEIPAGAECPPALHDYAASIGAFDEVTDGDVMLSVEFDPHSNAAYQEALAELQRMAGDLDARSEALDAREADLVARALDLDLRHADLETRDAGLAVRVAAFEASQAANPADAGQAAEDADLDKADAPKAKRGAKTDAGEPSA